MKFVRNIKYAYMILSVFLFCEGLYMLFFHPVYEANLFIAVGISLICYGGVKLLGYFSKEPYGLAFQFDLALGIPIMLIGILIVGSAALKDSFTPRLIGLLIGMEAAFRAQTALDARKFGIPKWWLLLLFSFLLETLGFLLFMFTQSAFSFYFSLLGLSLVLYGIQNFLTAFYTIRKIKK